MLNLKKLSEKELVELINSTADLKILEAAEQEYIDRLMPEPEEEEWTSYLN